MSLTMLSQDRWLLPEGIEETFADEAERLDRLGRRLIDWLAVWGYRLVIPPTIDYLDSLLIGTAHELDLQTLKLADPVSGRLIGLRADMTPQVARIDARTAKPGVPARLCYAGSVVHALTGHLEKSRNPIQIGAELYGAEGTAASGEVIQLMLETLEIAGVRDVFLDLGHVGIYRAIARQAGLSDLLENDIFDLLQRKDASDLARLIAETGISQTSADLLMALLELNGPVAILDDARQRLGAAGDDMEAALEELQVIAANVMERFPAVSLNVDLAELRGYQYHTGLVFAAFVPGQGKEIARGGRYDDIGRAFGMARPAVGFSADLRVLARLSPNADMAIVDEGHIFAPADKDSALDDLIRTLREQGRTVIRALGTADESPERLGCRQCLAKTDGVWRLV
jgi:ATP phosphoribosyltransferase regulatory subunit